MVLDLVNFGVVSESYINPQKICIWAGGLSLGGWQIMPTRTIKSRIFFKADVHFARVGPCTNISSTLIQIKYDGRPSDPMRTRPVPSLGSNPLPSIPKIQRFPMFRRLLQPQNFQMMGALRGVVQTIGDQKMFYLQYHGILVMPALGNSPELVQACLTPPPPSLISGASHSKVAPILGGAPLLLEPSLHAQHRERPREGGVVFRVWLLIPRIFLPPFSG
jgi:hypothetical protein